MSRRRNKILISIQHLCDSFDIIRIDRMAWNDITVLQCIVQIEQCDATGDWCGVDVFTGSHKYGIVIESSCHIRRCNFLIDFERMIVNDLSCGCVPKKWIFQWYADVVEEIAAIRYAMVFAGFQNGCQDILQ